MEFFWDVDDTQAVKTTSEQTRGLGQICSMPKSDLIGQRVTILLALASSHKASVFYSCHVVQFHIMFFEELCKKLIQCILSFRYLCYRHTMVLLCYWHILGILMNSSTLNTILDLGLRVFEFHFEKLKQILKVWAKHEV